VHWGRLHEQFRSPVIERLAAEERASIIRCRQLPNQWKQSDSLATLSRRVMFRSHPDKVGDRADADECRQTNPVSADKLAHSAIAEVVYVASPRLTGDMAAVIEVRAASVHAALPLRPQLSTPLCAEDRQPPAFSG